MKRIATTHGSPPIETPKVVAFDMNPESTLDARDAERLARFGDKGGKHGPLAARRIATMVRLPRVTDNRIEFLSHALGMRKAQLIALTVTVLASCQPGRWYVAISAFQKAGGGAVRNPLGYDDLWDAADIDDHDQPPKRQSG